MWSGWGNTVEVAGGAGESGMPAITVGCIQPAIYALL